MGVTVNWDNDDHTVIRYDIVDPWTMEEFFTALREDDAMLDEAGQPVHLIINATEAHTVPPNPITQLRNAASMIHPQLGMIVMVGTNTWLNTLGEIFYRAYGRRQGLASVKAAHTLEEARDLIAADAV